MRVLRGADQRQRSATLPRAWISRQGRQQYRLPPSTSERAWRGRRSPTRRPSTDAQDAAWSIGPHTKLVHDPAAGFRPGRELPCVRRYGPHRLGTSLGPHAMRDRKRPARQCTSRTARTRPYATVTCENAFPLLTERRRQTATVACGVAVRGAGDRGDASVV